MNDDFIIGDVICVECKKFIRTFKFRGSVEVFGSDKPISHGYCKECYEIKLKELKEIKEKV